MAGRKPKNPPMTQEEMTEAVQRKEARPRVYRAEATKVTDEAIRKSVLTALDEMKRTDGRQKINLDADVETVKKVAELYISLCADNNKNPTMSGLASSLGYSREGLYMYMKKHDTESGRFLQKCHDTFADLLAESALRNNTNGIVSIFILKSLFGFKDTTTIELANNDPNGEPSINEIALRAGLLADE